ncbi:hypothetical protein ACUH7Y_09610 [Clostridium beijerinckii]|uniref:Phage gp6-like head-tail connector protein n=1 Tax=Clostridium beijerinckii TaxID=1520 RepID=A0A7X9SMF5_CLOBE|nr:hypothetical protein [Clostridium beijerinckii]NMF04569.1 hypothetical protein [Clostridium beijerinckii]
MTLDEKLQALHPEVNSNKLIIYKGMAADAIRNHLNINDANDVIEQKYESAMLQLIENKIQYDSTNGVKSYTMSKTSVTYKDNKGFKITEDIEDLLPATFVKMLG